MSWMPKSPRGSREVLKAIHVTFYPPKLTLEIEQNGEIANHELDLQSLDSTTNLETLADQIIAEESSLKPKHRAKLIQTLESMVKMQGIEYNTYVLARIIKAHEMPLTDCCFNKMGGLFATASNDKTCRIWDTLSGKELHCLMGHKQTVNVCCFNNPIGDLLGTGSADKTSKIWKVGTGECLYTFTGHTDQIINIKFENETKTFASSSSDHTVRLYDLTTGQFHTELLGHTDIVPHIEFSNDGEIILTGSFDNTVKLWDIRSGSEISSLNGHTDDIFAAHFDFPCNKVLSASQDGTALIWDLRTNQAIAIMDGHGGGCTDACWSADGNYIATGAGDAVARIWDIDGKKLFDCRGHTGEINRVMFSPQSTRLLTASVDNSCKLWDTSTGLCVDTLKSHTNEIVCAAFNYSGKYIITASQDNTVIQWEASITDHRC